MADSKVTALSAISSITTDDLLYVVNDPGGTPASNKITVANFLSTISASNASSTSGILDVTNTGAGVAAWFESLTSSSNVMTLNGNALDMFSIQSSGTSGVWNMGVVAGESTIRNVNYGMTIESNGNAFTAVTFGLRLNVRSKNNTDDLVKITNNHSVGFLTGKFFLVTDSASNLFSVDGDGGMTVHPGASSKSDGRSHKRIETVQTTDATQTTLDSITLEDENTYHVEGIVTGVKSDGTDRASYKVAATVYRTGAGSATIQGSVTTLHSAESNASWDATLTVSSNDVRLSVTGVASTTIEWAGQLNVLNTSN